MLFLFTGSPSHQSISEWRMQSIARDSEDSTDDEFFDAHGKVTRFCIIHNIQYLQHIINSLKALFCVINMHYVYS